MRFNGVRFALVGLAGASLVSACSPGEDGKTSQVSQAVGASRSPLEAVKAALRAQGKGWAADRLTVASESYVARSRVTRFRMEQVIDGLRVHGSYVRASVGE